MYRYLLFDLDGTLTDSKEGIIKSLQYAFEKLGEPVPEESRLLKFIGPPLEDSFMNFCGYSREKAIRAIALFRERYVPIGKFENKPAPGLPELCAKLQKRRNRCAFRFVSVSAIHRLSRCSREVPRRAIGPKRISFVRPYAA